MMGKESLEKLKNIKGVGPKRYAHIVATLELLKKQPADLFSMSIDDLTHHFKLPKNVAGRITNDSLNEAKPDEPQDEIQAKGIRLFVKDSPEYPQKILGTLGTTSPQQLYVWGNLDLLNQLSIGFCGSRNVSEKGVEATADIARQVAELGWVVVSGHARGVDSMAHRVALESGGSTIIVAAEGILAFKLHTELKNIAKPEQLLIISEFEPNNGWAVGRAMQRNKTIVGLSDAMVLVESREKGGTFEAGKTALKFNVPLFVVQYQTMDTSSVGNRYFLSRGATPILKNAASGKANIAHIKESALLKQGQTRPTQEEVNQQILLF